MNNDLKPQWLIFFAILGFGIGDTFAETEGKTEEKPKSDWNTYKELEQTFYTYQKPGQTKVETKTLQTAEAKVEKLLSAIMKDVSTTDAKSKIDDVFDYQKKSMTEIITLAENYREASQKAKFNDQSTTFRVQSMCQTFADAYKALARGDLNGAKTNMKRALEKRDEIRGALMK